MFKLVSVLFVLAALCNPLNAFSMRPGFINPFVVNGTDTTIEDYPYQVSLRYSSFGSHICGGSIISENLVLTAAHCLYPDTPAQIVQFYSIRAGHTHRDQGFEVRLANAVYHENYNDDTYTNDVGLLRLAQNLVFSASVGPVALSEAPSLPYGKDSVLTGWGRLYHNGPLATILQRADIEVLNRPQCLQVYQFINPITDSMFCAGSFHGLVDSCNGDSGGPVVYNGVQIGIVSWGMACAAYGYPGVYADVAVLRQWIDVNSATV